MGFGFLRSSVSTGLDSAIQVFGAAYGITTIAARIIQAFFGHICSVEEACLAELVLIDCVRRVLRGCLRRSCLTLRFMFAESLSLILYEATSNFRKAQFEVAYWLTGCILARLMLLIVCL